MVTRSREVKIYFSGDESDALRAFNQIDRSSATVGNRLGGFQTRVNRVFSGIGRTLARSGAVIARGMTTAVLAATAALTALGISAVKEASEARKVARLTDAVIKSTGGSANVTAKEVSNLAEQLSVMAGVDDDVIQAGENLLLTFTNVRNRVGENNDIFDQATEAALNMSAALGKDLNSSVMMLGKALNDPTAGVSKLTRAGVQFSDKQKEMIQRLQETGDVAGAQSIILEELGVQFGGAAKAAATPWDRMRVAIDNVKESIGDRLLPWVDKFATWVSDHMPQIETWIKNAFEGIANFVRDALIPGFQSARNFMNNRLIPAFRAVRDFIEDKVIPAFRSLRDFVEEVVDAITKNWDQLVDDFNTNTNGMIDQLGDLRDTLDKIGKAFSGTTDQSANDWSGLGTAVRVGVRVMTFPLRILLEQIEGIGKAFALMVEAVRGHLRVFRRLIDRLPEWVKELPGKILSALGDMTRLLFDKGRDVILGFLNGMKSVLPNVGRIIRDAVTGGVPGAAGGAASRASGSGSSGAPPLSGGGKTGGTATKPPAPVVAPPAPDVAPPRSGTSYNQTSQQGATAGGYSGSTVNFYVTVNADGMYPEEVAAAVMDAMHQASVDMAGV